MERRTDTARGRRWCGKGATAGQSGREIGPVMTFGLILLLLAGLWLSDRPSATQAVEPTPTPTVIVPPASSPTPFVSYPTPTATTTPASSATPIAPPTPTAVAPPASSPTPMPSPTPPPSAAPSVSPAIAGIAPTSALAGGGAIALMVDGVNFVSGATVYWNGTALPTTFISGGQLSATVPAEEIAAAGTAEITVLNPAPTGQASNIAAFFVIAIAASVDNVVSGVSTTLSGTAIAATGGDPAAPQMTAEATGSGTVTVAQYAANPVAAPAPSDTSTFFDIYVATGSDFSALTATYCNLGGGNTVYWWTGAEWRAVSHQVYDPATGCATIALDTTTAPSTWQLTGTEFAVARARHSWSGVLQPINADGSSIFKAGSTIPVKFSLTGTSAGLTTLPAKLYVSRISTTVTGTEIETTSTAATDSGNSFRYDPREKQYIHNLSTKGLAPGTYELLIDLGDGEVHKVRISLRK